MSRTIMREETTDFEIVSLKIEVDYAVADFLKMAFADEKFRCRLLELRIFSCRDYISFIIRKQSIFFSFCSQ